MELRMWRLVVFILMCALFLGFVVQNLGNTSDISLGPWEFNEIPVFLTAFSSFLLGMVFATPFVLFFGKKRKKPSQDAYPHAPAGGEKQAAGPKKWWASKKKKDAVDTAKGKKAPDPPPNEAK